MHFLRLLAVWWPDAQSTRDDHLLACNFAKYLSILIFFTRRLSNKPFLIWLLTIPPHLEYVTTVPCHLSLIASFLTLMFHVVVWQHMQGVVGFLIAALVQIYQGTSSEKLFVHW